MTAPSPNDVRIRAHRLKTMLDRPGDHPDALAARARDTADDALALADLVEEQAAEIQQLSALKRAAEELRDAVANADPNLALKVSTPARHARGAAWVLPVTGVTLPGLLVGLAVAAAVE